MIESGILRGHTPDLFDQEEDMVRPAWRHAERGRTRNDHALTSKKSSNNSA
jgi:hypothetical protein